MKIYVGLSSKTAEKYNALHRPVIRIKPFSKKNPLIKTVFKKFYDYSHVILTSRDSVKIFFKRALKDFRIQRDILKKKNYVVIGPSTAKALLNQGNFSYIQPEISSSEGLIALLETVLTKCDKVLYLHSAFSRPVIVNYLKESQIDYKSAVHYTVRPLKTRLPEIKNIKEIIIASPSEVESLNRLWKGRWPTSINYRSIGPITEERLKLKLHQTEDLKKLLKI